MPFRVLLSDVIFALVFTSHSASNSRVSKVSKIVFTFCMMSEVRWAAVENVVFFNKRSIVIKLPVSTDKRTLYSKVWKAHTPTRGVLGKCYGDLPPGIFQPGPILEL